MSLDDVSVADRVDDTGGRLFLQLHFAAPLAGWSLGIITHVVLGEEFLQLDGLLVAQVEETVARMMGVKAELGAVAAHAALGAHDEAHAATAAELVLALAAGEVHAA